MCCGETVSLGHEVFVEVTWTHFQPRAAAVKWVRLRSSHPSMLLGTRQPKQNRADLTEQFRATQIGRSDRTGALAYDTVLLNDPHFTDVFAQPLTSFTSI